MSRPRAILTNAVHVIQLCLCGSLWGAREGGEMSGSGGSGDVGGARAGTPGIADCARLRVVVSLSNPQPEVISGLRIQDVLSVELREQAGYPQVAILADGSRLAGVVIGHALRQLLDCLAAGFEYVAVVRSIDGGNVELLVQPPP